MDDPLGDGLAVKVNKGFEKLRILQKHQTADRSTSDALGSGRVRDGAAWPSAVAQWSLRGKSNSPSASV
jgi:hypothetical protein